MSDYADWTESMELLGTRIMLPIDLQGAVIMVPFDIQGSTIMMPMDIQGQTINLEVDIVAQTIGNIGIDIKATTIGNLTIDVSAQSVGVYLQPEWASKEGTDKNFRASQANLSFGTYGLATHAVPAGKTLFITHIGGYSYAHAAADADKNQMMAISIYDTTAPGYLFETGGNGGAFANFSKPLVIPEGHTVWFMAWNFANHSCDVSVSASGYEV
jgi:hypothetical protein